MLKLMFEVFEEFKQATNKEERKQVLLRNQNVPEFKRLLYLNFHPEEISNVTEVPEYRSSDAPAGLGHNTIQYILRRNAYIFYKREIDSRKARIQLINILESLEPQEAEIFGKMLTKTLGDDIPYLTYKLVRETFPDLLLPDLDADVIQMKERNNA